MSNMCYFSMKVKGKKENINTFYNMLSQEGNIYMGRGACAEIKVKDNEAYIDGECKWSVEDSLIDDAKSMKNDPNSWFFDDDIDNTKLEFITLFEACEKLNLEMECYSEETGNCFQEHLLYRNNTIEINEARDIEETEDDNGDYKIVGGYENWGEFII